MSPQDTPPQNNDDIKVVSYDPAWPKLFADEAPRVQAALGENCITIHHIGSTAVPGLAAKPVIDMLAVVQDINKVDAANGALEALGYTAKGESGMPFRRLFHKGEPRTFNLHIFEQGNAEIERHLKFRDWLKAHDDDRDTYGILKQNLASLFNNDSDAYSLGKDAFAIDINMKTGDAGIRMVEALTHREWETAKKFRNKYYLDTYGTEDTNTWSFTHPDHIHLILYRGVTIIGYAHFQKWPNHRIALRLIYIDLSYRRKKMGTQFYQLCEKWFTGKGMESIQVETPEKSKAFFEKQNFTAMLFNDPEEAPPIVRSQAKMVETVALGKLLGKTRSHGRWHFKF